MAMSAWVAAMPAWVWAVASSPARSARAGVANSAAAPASMISFFMGFPFGSQRIGAQGMIPSRPKAYSDWEALPDAPGADAPLKQGKHLTYQMLARFRRRDWASGPVAGTAFMSLSCLMTVPLKVRPP